ncbi:hypothetical protein PSTT_16085 [Puccinia striiformis]|uniref:Uncharacterized protein n=2 Tax=Puccinia striiformis TaxID=27350 RepID=A0A0L0VA84_9BASI|nr:hypothetical protein PSTG_10806 [Puccinia striiformis f. sp. tritici PST-78]POV95698.1 hypothetical protein PSTT_16085 [Puccinia striiformis]
MGCCTQWPPKTHISETHSDTTGSHLHLAHSTTTCFADPDSRSSFDNVHLIIGPISGNDDVILGTPFLTKFDIGVLLKSRQIVTDRSNSGIYDYRVQTSVCGITLPPSTTPYPCAKKEINFLKDYTDIFPPDIPAVANGPDNLQHFPDIPYPKKPQAALSHVRHHIVLMDPKAVINEPQYPYPRKYLKSWRTLWAQHLDKGCI